MGHDTGLATKSFSIAEIAGLLNAEFIGDGEHQVTAIAPLDKALNNELSFLSDKKYAADLITSQAGCILLSEEAKETCQLNCIILKDPYLGFAKVAQLLDPTPIPIASVHKSAQIGDNVTLGNNISIAACCVLEDDCIIEDGVILAPNVVIGRGSVIGKNTRLYANVTIYHDVVIGESCIFHGGVVIGSDGFGYANENGAWVKIPQTGKVIIGNDVEIGANSCVDRGALNNTIISDGVKLDNLCHIAHNVEVGKSVAMAACSGIAGSTKVGDFCTFSGRTMILGHLTIAAKSHITVGSLINRSIEKAGAYSSGTGMQDNKSWRKSVVRFQQLDSMAKQIKNLEKKLKKLDSE